MGVELKTTPGKLPGFWNRDVIFFANLLSLFYGNEGETQELIRQVGGLATYGGRLVPIIDLLFRGGHNMLVLERRPNPDLLDYFRRDLQLGLPRFELLNDSEYHRFAEQCAGVSAGAPLLQGGAIREHDAAWVDGFVTDARLTELAAALGKATITSLEGSARGNNKLRLQRHLEEAGIPCFDTEVAATRDDIPGCLRALQKRGYREAVVKAQVGASGIGMVKLRADAGADAVADHLFYEGPCLVQGWLDDGIRGTRVVGSPSVQLFLDDDAVTLYDLTEQLLSAESVHEGNMAPPHYLAMHAGARALILKRAGEAGAWLHNQRYRGTASVDFLVVEQDGDLEVITCEINARVTGATYPAILARRFCEDGAWLMRNIRFEDNVHSGALLRRLDADGCLYHAGQPEGVLPINFNEAPDGDIEKGQFLCLGGDLAACETLLARVQRILPVAWHYDRD